MTFCDYFLRIFIRRICRALLGFSRGGVEIKQHLFNKIKKNDDCVQLVFLKVVVLISITK